MPNRLLRLSEVRSRVPFSRATIYAKIKLGEFPAPVKLSPGAEARAVAWLESDIEKFIADRVAASVSERAMVLQ